LRDGTGGFHDGGYYLLLRWWLHASSTPLRSHLGVVGGMDTVGELGIATNLLALQQPILNEIAGAMSRFSSSPTVSSSG
jgi:hypothetical protein